jgi:methionine-rich copper-binding protein CopC
VRLLGGLLLGAVLAALPASAWAHHVTVARSEPPAGARLSESPGALLVEFDQPVELPGSGLQVVDALGARVDRAPTVRAGSGDAALELALPRLPPGDYDVVWRITSQADGEYNEGRFGFTVRPDLRPLVVDRARLGGLGIVLFTAGLLGLLGSAGHRRDPPTSAD